MIYDMLNYNLFNAGSCTPYNMTGSLYMMNFYNQLKNYYAGRTAGTADSSGNTPALSGTVNTVSADFQTAFQEAFRKALQETMGITESTAAVSGATDNTQKSAAKAASNRTVAAQSAYQTMSSYSSHPSRIWTSSLV